MENSEPEQRCNALRHDLKAWEKKFALQHDGRKAGRDDIKANPTVSQKYKEYNKLREILSGRAAPQTPSRRSNPHSVSLDSNRTPKVPTQFVASTPSKRKRQNVADVSEAEDPTESQSPEGEGEGPTMIGPTPQRDGIALGLFDLLPAETPSKRRAVLADIAPNILQTPSKPHGNVESDTSPEMRARGEKTPLSSGKRFLFNQFVTPQKRKLDEEGTPTSALKGFSTPAFLRRNNVLNTINEADEATPRPAPWKRRVLGRSLSSMIQSLKKQEEDRLDEEADIMRELELEAEGIPIAKKPKGPDVLVEDSQGQMPLGPDRGLESDDDGHDENRAEDRLDQNGRPAKVWKKRGQKRQTRRVIMRPNFTKPKPPPTLALDEDSHEEQNEVEQTQGGLESTAPNHDSSGGSEYASDDSHTPTKKIRCTKSENAVTSQAQDKANKVGPVRTAARKVKATAHANYRRLKIKSKGGNGGKGRFGRRR